MRKQLRISAPRMELGVWDSGARVQGDSLRRVCLL